MLRSAPKNGASTVVAADAAVATKSAVIANLLRIAQTKMKTKSEGCLAKDSLFRWLKNYLFRMSMAKEVGIALLLLSAKTFLTNKKTEAKASVFSYL